jgi:myosin heavy subunit
MCADVAIHDTDGHNPHAHIMLTVRPLTDKGQWQHKTEKEYLCIRAGEECGFTAAEFKAAQAEGWEKQYPYKVGKKKAYMTATEAEAEGYERASKYPKCTKFGRQNPVSARWNSEEQLVAWRAAWADAVNHCLEQAGRAERIDHRSHAQRGLDEQPTVHEGVEAHALERRGIRSERCELNRQIKADNKLLRELKAAVAKITKAMQNTVPVIANALESIRQNMIVLRYGVLHYQYRRSDAENYLNQAKPAYSSYLELRQTIGAKQKECKRLQKQRSDTPLLNIFKRRELSARMSELTEEIEELRNEETVIMRSLQKETPAQMKEVKTEISDTETAVQRYLESEQKYAAELGSEKQKFDEVMSQAAEHDPDELIAARLSLRPGMEQQATQRIRSAIGALDTWVKECSIDDVDDSLGEAGMEEAFALRQRQKRMEEKLRQYEAQRKQKKRSWDMER